MTDDALKRWLRTTDQALPGGPEVSLGLYERLQFVASLLAELGEAMPLPALVFREAGDKVSAIPLRPRCVVGRDASADFALSDTRLSRRHFQLVSGLETTVIEDLKSRNGTYVNGRRVSRQELLDGDIIEAGRCVFVFLQQVGEV
jgi:hypothetical protein